MRLRTRIAIDPEATYKVTVRHRQLVDPVNVANDGQTNKARLYIGVDTKDESFDELSTDLATGFNYGVVNGIYQDTADGTLTQVGEFSGYNTTSGTDNSKFDPEGQYFDLVILSGYYTGGFSSVTTEAEALIEAISIEKVSNSVESYGEAGQPAPEDFQKGLASGLSRYALDGTGNYADFVNFNPGDDSSTGDNNMLLLDKQANGVKVARQTYGDATGYKNGDVYTLDYTSASDKRLKEDVTEITDGLSKINELRPVTYKWTDDYITSGMSKNPTEREVKDGKVVVPAVKEVNVGLIAQEVQEVLPTVVTEGAIKLKGEDRMSLQYEKLVPHLISAIKELSARVEQLEGSPGLTAAEKHLKSNLMAGE